MCNQLAPKSLLHGAPYYQNGGHCSPLLADRAGFYAFKCIVNVDPEPRKGIGSTFRPHLNCMFKCSLKNLHMDTGFLYLHYPSSLGPCKKGGGVEDYLKFWECQVIPLHHLYDWYYPLSTSIGNSISFPSKYQLILFTRVQNVRENGRFSFRERGALEVN